MRYFRIGSTWLQDTINPVDTPMEANEADLSAYYGLPVSGVELPDDAPDPRTGEFVPEPQRPALELPLPSPLSQLKDALLADPNIAPETKEAIQQISGGDVKDMGIVPLTPSVK